MANIPPFKYQHPFPLGEDRTEYYLLTKDYVSNHNLRVRMQSIFFQFISTQQIYLTLLLRLRLCSSILHIGSRQAKAQQAEST